MESIIQETEKWCQDSSNQEFMHGVPKAEADTPQEAFGSSVAATVPRISPQPTCIIAYSPDGSLAADIAKFRPTVPVLCVVGSAKAGRQLQVIRGVHPLLLPGVERTWPSVLEAIKAMGFCKSGDSVILVSRQQEVINSSRGDVASGTGDFSLNVVKAI